MQETKLKNGNSDNFNDTKFYTRERINLCASAIITLSILALLIVPIWLLYYIVAGSDGILSGRGTAICVGILLIATLFFSAVLSLFTKARRHETLAAAAASVFFELCLAQSLTSPRYCAVLVVFLGNVRP